MDLLDNVIQPYAWGSRTALAELQGRPSPNPTPEAELWMGAHPAAPSHVVRGSARRSLRELIAAAPEAELGEACARRFGGRLPFLLKVLAADAPLSLQAHPSLEQAKEGFERENAAGIPLSAPHRNYKDDNHKPELICALTPFDALCGFRETASTLRFVDLLGVPEVRSHFEVLRTASPAAEGLQRTFEALLTLSRAEAKPLVEALGAASVRTRRAQPEFTLELEWVEKLASAYPDDPGVLAALLLNVTRLEPGEALYLPAGNLHAYLRGVGVEIMASSDNVLRGGCTPKHVDVPELLRVLTFAEAGVGRTPIETSSGGEHVYVTPAPELRLSRIEVTSPSSAPSGFGRTGPEILLCTRGACELRTARGGTQPLHKGESVFIPWADGEWSASGDATIFRAQPGR